jgi:hypothetical protein
MEEVELQSWFISQKNYTICLKTNLAYFTNHEYNLKHVQMQALETSDVTIKKSFTYSEVWFRLVLYVEHKWGHIQLINKTTHVISGHIQSCITACCLWLSKIFIPLGCIRFFTEMSDYLIPGLPGTILVECTMNHDEEVQKNWLC